MVFFHIDGRFGGSLWFGALGIIGIGLFSQVTALMVKN